jgi:di/tricarboxylate transporter
VLAITVTLWAGLLTFAEATEAFTDRTVFLIFTALLMASAVDKTGLGCRISLLFIAAVGGTALGLTYALMGADLLLALGMPSTTAREGGVFLPILRGISDSYGSHPGASFASGWRPGWHGLLRLPRHVLTHTCVHLCLDHHAMPQVTRPASCWVPS